MPHSPCLRSEAPSPLLVGTLFTLDVLTRVCVTLYNYERLGGVERVKADWETESQATRVFWAGPARTESVFVLKLPPVVLCGPREIC